MKQQALFDAIKRNDLSEVFKMLMAFTNLANLRDNVNLALLTYDI